MPNRTAGRGAVQRYRAAAAPVRGLAEQRQQRQGSPRRGPSAQVPRPRPDPPRRRGPTPRRALPAAAPTNRPRHAPAAAGRDQADSH